MPGVSFRLKHIVITRALYGLKSSGAARRVHLASTMTDLSFTPCQADPDVWMQPAVKPGSTKYYEYVLIYVNDILVISQRASTIMDNLSVLYCLKENPVNGKRYDTLDYYLGANIGLYTLPGDTSGKQKWYVKTVDYVSDVIKNVEGKLAEANRQLTVCKGVYTYDIWI